jgi:lambda family phage tail tape measure protein
MQGPSAGVVRPEEGTGLAGIDVDVDVDGTGAKAQKIKDISERMFEARKAALEFETEKEKLKLEFAVRRLEIEESEVGERLKAIQLLEAEDKLARGLLKIDEERAEELKRLFNSFKIKSGGFDFSGIDQGEGPKTPFEALRKGADEFTDSLKGALGAAKELATVGLQGISDGITDLVVNGTLNFREFAASLLRDMARIIMQQIVMKSLMQAIGFGGGGVNASQFELANPTQFDVSMLWRP